MKQRNTPFEGTSVVSKRNFIYLGFLCLVLCSLFVNNAAQSRVHQIGEISLSNKKSHLWILGLDDNGYIENPDNIKNIQKSIEKNKPDLFFLFVHGWRNDASVSSQKNGDLLRFKTFIEETATIFQQHPTLRRWGMEKVMGVYVGWHGSTWGAFDIFSFWNRAHVAGRIGDNQQTLMEINRLIEQTRKSRPNARVVLIAHSLGGRIVNGWLNQIEDPVAMDKFLPDLSVVVSPAAPVEQLETLIENYDQHLKKNSRRGPRIVWVTSEGDNVTKIAYPIGTFETAIAQDTKTRTHDILEASAPKNGTRLCNDQDPILVYNLACDQTLDDWRIKVGENKYISLQQSPLHQAHPYWVLRLPEELLPSHMSFFHPKFQSVVAAIFKFSQVGPGAK